MTERTMATKQDSKIAENDLARRRPARGAFALSLAPLAMTLACGASALPSPAVATTAARAQTDDDTGYGYKFEPDSAKNAGGSPASALSLAHAPGDRIPPETIQAIARSHYDVLTACYDAGLKRDPSLRGTVSVKFVVGANGVTNEAADAKSTLPDAEVVSCVVGEFARLSYPAGGGILTVLYPVDFAP